jgi:hypothetical protein
VVIIWRGFRHALKNAVADLLNADHVSIRQFYRGATKHYQRRGGGDVLDVGTVGLLDLAIDVSDRHRPRPKGIGIQDKRYK